MNYSVALMKSKNFQHLLMRLMRPNVVIARVQFLILNNIKENNILIIIKTMIVERK